ncbi:MAG: DEAD/DEAH box helicase family protein [Acidimicrobiales bacterium]
MTRTVTLRKWQHAALRAFLDKVGREKDIEGGRRDFLAVACPGAGKTTFALTAVRHWLAGQRRPFVVVVPTRHLKAQWASAADRFGFHLEPEWEGGDSAMPTDMHGIVVTYAQVATSARALRALSDGGIVILDEIHHAGGDRTWGAGVQEAFEHAASAAAPVRHPVPVRRCADPLRHVHPR